jgi:hypothetical protein
MSLHEDLLKRFPARTWPYGTKKDVKILLAEDGCVLGVDGDNEGYILIGEPDHATVEEQRTIEFRSGGPTGGHWKLLPKQAPGSQGAPARRPDQAAR